MNIDDIFSPARTWSLMKKYVADNRTTLIISGAFVTVVMVLIGLINALAYFDSEQSRTALEAEVDFMLVAFTVGGCLIASVMFKPLWNDKSAIGMLMTPASAFEQWLVRWIIAVPVYIVWALLSAVFADAVKCFAGNYILGGEFSMIPWRDVLNVFNSHTAFNLYGVLLLFVFTQSFYILGSVVWRKHAFVKTFFAMGVLFMLYAVPSVYVAEMMTQSKYVYTGSKADYLFSYAPTQIFIWLSVIVNYALTVMRLRETDIVHRF